MNKFRKMEEKAISNNFKSFEIKGSESEQRNPSRVLEYAKQLHLKRFPEEYDFMLDDQVDAAMRRRGDNPMSQEYLYKIALKRSEAGVAQLDASGMPTSSDSFRLCYREAEAAVGDHSSQAY